MERESSKRSKLSRKFPQFLGLGFSAKISIPLDASRYMQEPSSTACCRPPPRSGGRETPSKRSAPLCSPYRRGNLKPTARAAIRLRRRPRSQTRPPPSIWDRRWWRRRSWIERRRSRGRRCCRRNRRWGAMTRGRALLRTESRTRRTRPSRRSRRTRRRRREGCP